MGKGGVGEMLAGQWVAGVREGMEGMEGIIVTRRMRAHSGSGRAATPLSCVGLELSSPSSPSPPDRVYPVDFLVIHVSAFAEIILSHFHFILSIPSLSEKTNQGIEKKTDDTTKCRKGAAA